GGVENALSIAETASLGAQLPHLEIPLIEHLNFSDGVRDFLPIGADILHRSSADAAGNAAQAFDAGAVAGYRARYESVPFLARTYSKQHGIFVDLLFDACNRHPQDKARKSRIGNNQVAAAP